MPNRPVNAAGMRIEPPPSAPTAMVASPAATEAAAPPLDSFVDAPALRRGHLTELAALLADAGDTTNAARVWARLAQGGYGRAAVVQALKQQVAHRTATGDVHGAVDALAALMPIDPAAARTAAHKLAGAVEAKPLAEAVGAFIQVQPHHDAVSDLVALAAQRLAQSGVAEIPAEIAARFALDSFESREAEEAGAALEGWWVTHAIHPRPDIRNETAQAPPVTRDAGNPAVRWFAPTDTFGFVPAGPGNLGLTRYSTAEYNAADNGLKEVRIGTKSVDNLWINGEKVALPLAYHVDSLEEAVVLAELRKGTNVIQVAQHGTHDPLQVSIHDTLPPPDPPRPVQAAAKTDTLQTVSTG